MYTLKNQDVRDRYNTAIQEGRYENDYEFNRWFNHARNRTEYAMTYLAIKRHLAGNDFSRCLEIGPGPGTWTRLLYRVNPASQFDLIDISKAMHSQFELEMRSLPNIQYHVMDVMNYDVDVAHDFIFSSRAVEYFNDKSSFFSKLQTLMAKDGKGIIITKNPYHGVRKSKQSSHQGQIPMSTMKQYLENNNFTDITFYPVVIRIPIISRFTSEVSERLHTRWVNKELDIHATNRTIESYMVTFARL